MDQWSTRLLCQRTLSMVDRAWAFSGGRLVVAKLACRCRKAGRIKASSLRSLSLQAVQGVGRIQPSLYRT